MLGHNRVIIIDIPSVESALTFKTPSDCEALAISTDAQLLALASNNGIEKHDVVRGYLNGTISTSSQKVTALGFSGDGQLIATGNDCDVYIWDVLSCKPCDILQPLSTCRTFTQQQLDGYMVNFFR